jgi:hypothetical protein
MNKNVHDRKNFQHGECKINSVYGGENVPVFTSRLFHPCNTIFRQEAKSVVTVYNVQIWLHFKIFKLDYFSARVTILFSRRLGSVNYS